MDRYHGSARPDTGPEDALFRDLKRAARQQVRAARKQLRDNRRQWIVLAGASPTTTPMWTSRRGWLSELDAWTDTTGGAAVLAAKRLRPALLLRVAETLADHADHASGRHCAATNATIASVAGCSARTVTTVRAVLRDAGLAVEIRRGTGSAMTPQCRRRPSVWHLISRAQPVDNARVCDLPPSLCDRRLSHVGKRSPSVRTRPPTKNSSKPHGQRRRAPRPLRLQQLAAAIVAGSIGLDAVHPGHVCDALLRSGLDLTAWTAPQILAALNTDMHETGWSWPNRIERPGAFLASRLRRLSPRPLVITRPAKLTPVAEHPASPPASAATRAAAIAYFRTHRFGDGARYAIAEVAGGGERHDSPHLAHREPSAANALRRLSASVSTECTR
jgi:hypothetical protein